MVGAGGMLGQDVMRGCSATTPWGSRTPSWTSTDARGRARRGGGGAAPTWSSTAPPTRTWTAPRSDADEAAAGERRGRGHRGRARPPAVLYVSSDYVFDGTKREPYLESDPTGPVSSYGRSKLRRGGRHRRRQPAPLHRPLVVAVRRRRQELRRHDAARRARARRGARGAPTRWAAPPTRATSRDALVRIASGEDYGIHHAAAAGQCSWYDLAAAAFERAGVDCRLEPITTAEYPRPAPRPAYSVLGTERDAAAARLAGGARRATWPSGRCTREAARDRRGRVHRLHLRAARGATTHEVVVLDKLTYAGRRENLPEGVPLVVGAIEDPTSVREVMEGVDAVVNFAADSHVDRSIADQEAFARDARDRHRRPARRRARAGGAALPAGLDRRGVRLDRVRARSRRSRRSTPPPPTRRPRPPATCWSRRTPTPTGSRR